jgi:hypothetical protein
MDITKNNYEIWAVNYLEGELEPSEVAQFMAFVSENPELSDELESLRHSFSQEHVQTCTEDFSFLKKSYTPSELNQNTFDEYCIAYYEHDLDEEATAALLAYIKEDKQREVVFKAFSKIKITADTSICFKDKEALKRLPKSVFSNKQARFISVVSVAASIIFIAGLLFRFLMPGSTPPVDVSVAGLNTTTEMNAESIEIDDAEHEQFSLLPVKSKAVYVVQKQEPITLAKTHAIDTSKEVPFIVAERIEIKQIELSVSTLEKSIKESSVEYYPSEEELSAPEIALTAIQNKSASLLAKAGNLTLNNVLKKSVDGINQIAETDLQYNSETDDDGKITVFALSSERFNIKRKIRNN